MIKTTNLSHTYQRGKVIVEALKGVNTRIGENQFLAIIGETGSGKTTFTQHLNALLKPTDGEVEVLDYKIDSNKKKQKKIPYKSLRKDVGMVFQFPEQQVFARSVLEDVMFAPLNFGATIEEAQHAAKEILALLRVDESMHDQPPFLLSGGQKRKVALAGVLVTSPKIVVLDEPFAGLDPKSREELIEIMKMYQQKTGAMMLVISHDMDLVWNLCERTIVFKSGNIMFDGMTKDLFLDDALVHELAIEKPTILAAEQYLEAIRGDGNE